MLPWRGCRRVCTSVSSSCGVAAAGAGALLDSCKLENGSKIGAGAIVQSGAVVGVAAEVAAGAVVAAGAHIPNGEVRPRF